MWSKTKNFVNLNENEKFCEFGQPDDYEAIRSVTVWYEMLEEDLVGESEEVECPECGEEYDSKSALKSHFGRSHSGDLMASCTQVGEVYFEDQIHQKISSQTPFGIDTVRRLVKIGKLPEETLWLIEEN